MEGRTSSGTKTGTLSQKIRAQTTRSSAHPLISNLDPITLDPRPGSGVQDREGPHYSYGPTTQSAGKALCWDTWGLNLLSATLFKRFTLFLKIYFTFLICGCVGVYTCERSVLGSQKRAPDPLQLKLQTTAVPCGCRELIRVFHKSNKCS